MPKKKTPKNIAVIFNLPIALRVALRKKVAAGERSAFVAELLAAKLKVVLPKKVAAKKRVAKKVAPKKVVKKVAAKKKTVFGRLFKK